MAGGEVCYAHSGAKVGRPSVLTPEVHARIVQLVKTGCSGEGAAQAAGISATTYYEIMKAAREEESGPHRELLEALEQARAEAYAFAMANWRRDMATPGNWRANVAYVDRFDRGRFPLEAPTPQGKPPDREERRPDLARLSDEQLRCLEALYPDDEQEGER
jgi:hypothetical protein